MVSLLALLVIPRQAVGDPVLVSAGLVTATLALGSVTAGMLLGHWYLVTPKLSPVPLRRLIWPLIGALVTQASSWPGRWSRLGDQALPTA